jgi:small redox-active disulfide protein 2
MEVKILGPGCPRCQQTEKAVKQAVAETGIEASVEHVSDFMEIASYGVFGTPAVVVDGEVKSVGKIASREVRNDKRSVDRKGAERARLF